MELKRLILEGENMTFEEMKSKNQDLQFLVLKKMLTEKINISSFSLDTIKTLQLYDEKNGYNNAASLLADNNDFLGIDIARFGDNINIILDRETYSNMSILSQYNKTINLFRKYYLYDEISGAIRETKELIPEVAFTGKL